MSYRARNMQKTAYTVIQAVLYLLKSHKELDRIQIIKLLYLSDKYHLMHYGRTVTGDEYWARKMGPVGLMAKNILSFDDNRTNSLDGDVLSSVERHLEKFEDSYRSRNQKCDFELLSDSDKRALDFVAGKFGGMGSFALRDYTHKYPEWKKHEHVFRADPKSNPRRKIPQKELFSIIDDQLGLTPADVDQARELFADF